MGSSLNKGRGTPAAITGKPTMRMVASRVNLSLSTVSLALRGSETIPKATRERVLAAARDLNYAPTSRQHSEIRAEVRQIVFVMADNGNIPVTANPFFGEVLHGVEAACRTYDINLIFRTLPFPTPSTEPLLSSLQKLAYNGLLLAGPFQSAIVEQIANAIHGPLVLIDNLLPAIPYDAVVTDDVGGGYLATQHLLALGHQRIAAVVGETARSSYMERYRGYLIACAEAGITPSEPIMCGFHREQVYEVFRHLLAAPEPPTAFFCVNDSYAIYGIEALGEYGYHVPADISVVGFDNLAQVELASVPLTTVQNLPRMLGQVGLQRLLARLDGDHSPRQSVALRTELVLRASTAPYHA
jgi:LacI family transcriptional regulator